jgi:hypothetical protein
MESTYGKPVFKAYQCHITLPTKLTIPPRMEDLYFSEYKLFCPLSTTRPSSVVILRRTHDNEVAGSRPTSTNYSVRNGMTHTVGPRQFIYFLCLF